MTAWTPHFSVMWDPTHDGKTKLQATVDGLADTGFLALARFTSRRLYSRRCCWDEEAKAYIPELPQLGRQRLVSPWACPAAPTGIGPDGRPCRTKLKTPRVWEATLGGRARDLHRHRGGRATSSTGGSCNQWEDAETNGNWNEAGTGLRREAPFKTDRSQFVYDLQTPEAAHRTLPGHHGVSCASARAGPRRSLSYTWSKYEGPVDSSFASVFLDNPGQTQYFYGPLPADIRHDVRAQVTYQINSWLSVGATYQFSAAGPYNRFVLRSGVRRLQPLHRPPGLRLERDAEPRRRPPLRLPDISQLNLQARASLEPLIKQRIEIWVDALNVLALRTTTSVVQTPITQFFGRPTSRMAPWN